MNRLIILLMFFAPLVSAQGQVAPFSFMGGGGIFTPADIDSLKAWYVAADVGDSLGKSDGDTTYILPNRAKWLQPYTFEDAFQLSDGSKPVYRSDSACIVFDGTSDYMTANTGYPWAVGAYTLVLVVRNYNQAITKYWTDSPNRMIVGFNTPPGWSMYNGTWVQSTVDNGPDTLRIITAVFNGASSFIRVNGRTQAAGNAGGPSLGASIRIATRNTANSNYPMGGFASS